MPPLVGAAWTLIVQLAPGERDAPHVPPAAIENGAGGEEMEFNDSVPPPELLTVTVLTTELPTGTIPKSIAVGETLICPHAATVTAREQVLVPPRLFLTVRVQV